MQLKTKPAIIRTGITLLGVILLTANVMWAQNPRITFPGRTVTIKEGMAAIMNQTDYVFAVNYTGFDIQKTVSLTDRSLPLTQALDQLLYGSNRSYAIKGSHIILTPRTVPAAPTAAAPPKPNTVAVQPANTAAAPVSAPSRFEDDVKAYNERIAVQEVSTPQPPTVRYDTLVKTIPHDGVFVYPPKTIMPVVTTQEVPFTPNTPPILSLKTNLLYGGLALAPNLGLEIGLGRRTSLELIGSYNGWKRKGTAEDNKKLVHWIAKPEFRFWLRERFNGHFFGVHAFYWQYNVGEHKIPLLFDKEFRYEGNAYGAGLSYGYHWMWSRRWGMEFTVGAGVALMKYDKYDCVRCSESLGEFKKTYVGPTSAGIKLIFMIK